MQKNSLNAVWKYGTVNWYKQACGKSAEDRKAGFMNSLSMGREVFEREIFALNKMKNQLDGTFEAVLQEIMSCRGKAVFIGMGKSGHVAKKIAASMSSLGTCAICLHPAECLHGDLGMIQKQDLAVLISHSGESDEIQRIIPGIKKIGAVLIGITGNGDSSLARACKITQVMEGMTEACHLGLAPTSSTTAVMVYGDALAVAAARLKGFDRKDFARFHPAGALGKSLVTRAADLMHPLAPSSFVNMDDTLADALQAMIETGTDLIAVVDHENRLMGILTNGDLKRKLKLQGNMLAAGIGDIVHKYPCFVDDSAMAADALKIMAENHVHAMPVVKNNRPVGVIEKREIMKYGICL